MSSEFTEATILVLAPNRRDQRAVIQALTATGATLEQANGLEDARLLLSSRAFDVVVVDFGLPDADAWQTERDDYFRFLSEVEVPLVLFSGRRDHVDLQRLFNEASVSHLVAKNEPLELDELIVTIAKLLDGDIFGVEKYLGYGVQPVRHDVASSQAKDTLLQELSAFARELGIRRRLVATLKTVADEFLTNAIYNAPVDAEGERIYASRSRTEAVELSADQTCRFEYACDGRYVALSVRDRFGSLDPETVLDYLARCYAMGDDQIEEKEGGAGMGFFFILENLNRFVINIAPGETTEMIGFIDVSGTYRNFAEQGKSFHIFTSG